MQAQTLKDGNTEAITHKAPPRSRTRPKMEFWKTAQTLVFSLLGLAVGGDSSNKREPVRSTTLLQALHNIEGKP